MPSNGTSNQFVVRDIPASVYANGVDGSAGNVISTANIAAINGAAQFTTEIWIKPVGTAKSSVIYDNSQAGVTDSFFLSMDANYSLFAYQTIGTLSKNILGTTARVIPGKWNLINVTYNGALISIFLNGSVIATLAASGTLGTNNGIFRIGSYHNGAFSLTFLGYIHRPRLYTLGMTLQEHQDRYYSDKTSAALQAALIMDLDTTISSGTTLTDLSGAGNNGTLGASASWGEDTPFKTQKFQREISSSILFNGSNTDVLYSGAGVTGFATASSFAGWMFIAPGSTTSRITVCRYGDGGSERIGLCFQQTGAVGTEVWALQAGYWNGSAYTLSGTGTVKSGAWFHVAITWNGTTMKAYINGFLLQGTCASPATGSTTGLRLGNQSGAFWIGNQSRVKLYTRVLTQEEVTRLATHRDEQVSTSGLWVDWRLDEQSGTSITDYSGNSRTGTLSNGARNANTPSRLGLLARHYESSLVFNGTSSALVKTTPTGINTGTSSRSVSGWIYLTSNAIQTIAQFKVNGSNQSPAFALGQISNIYYFAFDTINAGNNLTMTLAQFSAAFPLYKWLHVAYVMTTTNISLYVNGTLIISTNWGTVINTSAYDNLFLGKTQDGSNTNQYWFAGRMQDIRIHNAALTQAQIQDEYLDGELSSSIVSRFIGQEGAGTTVSDSVGTNHLTNTSVTWISDTPIKRGRDRSGNLVKNGNFEYIPPFTAATLNQTDRWIDGTSGGSATNNLFRIKSATTSVYSGGTSFSMQFDTIAGRNCVRIISIGKIYKSGGTITQLQASLTAYSGPTLTETDRANLIEVQPNTSYVLSGDYYINQCDSQVSPRMAAVEYSSALARVATSAVSALQDVSTGWRNVSLTFTTTSTTRYITVYGLAIGAGADFTDGNCDVAFSRYSLTPVFPEGQKPANGNLVKNFDFEVAPTFVAAHTSAAKWIDGTAAGSTTNATYKWAALSGAVTASASVSFDSTVAHSGSSSLKLSTLDASGAIAVSHTLATSPPATNTVLIPLNPSTSYTLNFYLKTTNVATNGAFAFVREYSSTLGTLVTTNTSKLSGTNDWTLVTLTFTTSATTQYGAIALFNNVAGNISDAWFDDIYLGQ